MRVETASEIKRPGKSSGRTAETYPAEGSLARRVYDKLATAKGRPVSLKGLWGDKPRSHLGGAIYYLMDFYGCDIRRCARGSCEYVLAGEWFGAHYSDYVNQAIDEAILNGERAS